VDIPVGILPANRVIGTVPCTRHPVSSRGPARHANPHGNRSFILEGRTMKRRILALGILCAAVVAIIGASPSAVQSQVPNPVVGKVETPDGDPVEGVVVCFYNGQYYLWSTYTNEYGYFFAELYPCEIYVTAIVGYSQSGPGSTRWIECDPWITTDFGTIVWDDKWIPHH